MIARARALPIVWQTLMLLIASIAVAQAMGVLVLVIAPPPRPDFNRMGDIAVALAGTASPGREGREQGDRERELVVSRTAAAPAGRPRMVTDPAITAALADRLHVPVTDVRLWYEPDRRDTSLFGGGGRGRRRPVSMRDGERLFFTPLVAGVRSGAAWIVAETAPPPLIPPWQRRMALWFGLTAVVLSPFAWLFARALARPIRRFAEAADRLGTDPLAPPVDEGGGPAELRVAARALNRMQRRLADYVGERTDMIGAIAHDLRTPLARIAFRVEGAPDPVRDKVMADVDQMRRMLAATIGFVRNTGAGGLRVEVDLAALIGALVVQEADLGRAVEAGDLAPATVFGDPLALERMLQNLIDNGVAYGGRVTITLDRVDANAVVRIGDEGPGLSDDLLARVFQPFVRGDPSRNRDTGGIGLGLTIARSVAEDHGGLLTLANGAEGGLVATCRLPLAGDTRA